MNIFIRLGLLILFLLPAQSIAQLQSLETDNIRLIYLGRPHYFIVQHAARCFENSYKFHRQLFNYSTDEKTTVFIHDFSDFGNAGAKSTPGNTLILSLSPFSYAYETVTANERINWVTNHEIVHIIATDQASYSDRLFRKLFFGKVETDALHPESMVYSYLTNPRNYAPRWYHEGIAVFMETWMSGGIGRALGAYDEMVFRTLTLEGEHFYNPIELQTAATRQNFQVLTNAYLYGTRFISYVALKFGPERVINWVRRDTGSKSFFSSQFKQEFDISLEQMWSEWIAWEKEFQEENLAAVRAFPRTSIQDIAPTSLGSVSNACIDAKRGKVYVGVNYPGELAHITEINLQSGQSRKITDIKGAAIFHVTSLAYDADSLNLYYTTDNNQWRDLNVINLTSGKRKRLMKDGRVGDMVFNPSDRSIWGIRHFNGISTIVRVPPPYDEWNQLYSWPYGSDMYDLDISPDGATLTGALSSIQGENKLVKMNTADLLGGSSAYEELFNFENSTPANFTFSPDGTYLYGSSYYSGISNIFRYDIGARDMSAVSNVESGVFRPLAFDPDTLFVFKYTSSGFRPAKISSATIENINAINFLGQAIVEKHPIVRDWKVPSPATVNLDSLSLSEQSYSPLKSIGLDSAYPIVTGYKESVAIGLKFNLASPLNIHSLSLTTSYSPDSSLPQKERVHFGLRYKHANWTAILRNNRSDFYDLFGPTKTSRKGLNYGLQYDKSLILDGPRNMGYLLSANGFNNLEKLPRYQNVNTSFDEFYSAYAVFYYSYLSASLGAVNYEKGFSVELATSNTFVQSDVFPQVTLDANVGIPIGLVRHTSLWLRNSLGYAFGDRFDPFANFYFGGFGNNWIDYRSERRFQQSTGFPGAELNELFGKSYFRSLIELDLPAVYFSGLGTNVLYPAWMRLALFGGGLLTSFDDADFRRFAITTGGQLDIRLVAISNLSFTLSLGYGITIREKDTLPENQDRVTDEFMFSLKIL